MPIAKGFQRFKSNTVFSRKVVTEISNLVPGLSAQQFGRSSVASFTSKRPIRKKVTSADRRAMLESFVNKYRAMNMGKFPPIRIAQKEVGGGFYMIRKMLQEMEYNFKILSLEKGTVKENKKQTKGEHTISSKIAIESSENEVSSSQINMDRQLCKDASPQIVSNFDTNFELMKGLRPSTSSEDTGSGNTTRDDTHKIATEGYDSRGQCFEKPESNTKDETLVEDNFGRDDSESKVEQHDGMRNILRDMPERQKDDGLREKPSIWGNLKLLATGFLNIWKK